MSYVEIKQPHLVQQHHELESGWDGNNRLLRDIRQAKRHTKMTQDIKRFVIHSLDPSLEIPGMKEIIDLRKSEANGVIERISSTFNFQHHAGTDTGTELKVVKIIMVREDELMKLQHIVQTATRNRSFDRSCVSILETLASIRENTLNYLEALCLWRQSVPHSNAITTLREFFWEGKNYTLKIVRDLDFLAGVRPILQKLKLSSEQLRCNPLMLTNNLEDPSTVIDPVERASQDCQGNTNGSAFQARLRLRFAERILLQEIEEYGTSNDEFITDGGNSAEILRLGESTTSQQVSTVVDASGGGVGRGGGGARGMSPQQQLQQYHHRPQVRSKSMISPSSSSSIPVRGGVGGGGGMTDRGGSSVGGAGSSLGGGSRPGSRVGTTGSRSSNNVNAKPKSAPSGSWRNPTKRPTSSNYAGTPVSVRKAAHPRGWVHATQKDYSGGDALFHLQQLRASQASITGRFGGGGGESRSNKSASSVETAVLGGASISNSISSKARMTSPQTASSRSGRRGKEANATAIAAAIVEDFQTSFPHSRSSKSAPTYGTSDFLNNNDSSLISSFEGSSSLVGPAAGTGPDSGEGGGTANDDERKNLFGAVYVQNLPPGFEFGPNMMPVRIRKPSNSVKLGRAGLHQELERDGLIVDGNPSPPPLVPEAQPHADQQDFSRRAASSSSSNRLVGSQHQVPVPMEGAPSSRKRATTAGASKKKKSGPAPHNSLELLPFYTEVVHGLYKYPLLIALLYSREKRSAAAARRRQEYQQSTYTPSSPARGKSNPNSSSSSSGAGFGGGNGGGMGAGGNTSSFAMLEMQQERLSELRNVLLSDDSSTTFNRLICKVYDCIGYTEYVIYINPREYDMLLSDMNAQYATRPAAGSTGSSNNNNNNTNNNNSTSNHSNQNHPDSHRASRHFQPDNRLWWAENIKRVIRVQLKRNGRLHLSISKSAIEVLVYEAIQAEEAAEKQKQQQQQQQQQQQEVGVSGAGASLLLADEGVRADPQALEAARVSSANRAANNNSRPSSNQQQQLLGANSTSGHSSTTRNINNNVSNSNSGYGGTIENGINNDNGSSDGSGFFRKQFASMFAQGNPAPAEDVDVDVDGNDNPQVDYGEDGFEEDEADWRATGITSTPQQRQQSEKDEENSYGNDFEN